MNFLFKKWKKKLSDFQKLAGVHQHGLQVFPAKNIRDESKETKYPSNILYEWIRHFNSSTRSNVFTKPIPSRGIWKHRTDNEELKSTEFDGVFRKKFKLLFDRFYSSFAQRRKSVEEMIHQKKNRSHQTPKIIKSRQSYYHCSFYYLTRARWDSHELHYKTNINCK